MDSPAVGRSAWQADMSLILLPALAVFAYCAFDRSLFFDGDTNWHLAAGRWILANGVSPRVDPFSYTASGRLWVAHEWLSEALMALAYGAAGWGGVVVLIGAAAAATTALMAAELRRWLGPLSVIAALGVSFMLLVPHLLLRPHILALLLLVLWTSRLLEARRLGRSPPLWLLPLMVVWANLHGSYIFGLAFIGPFALEALTAARGAGRLSAALKWGAFGVAAVLAALLTPNGLDGLLLPFKVMTMTILTALSEWKAADFGRPTPLEFALMFTLFICLYRGVRMGWARLALLLLLLHMALQHIRQEFVLAVVGPLLLAEPLGRAFEPGKALPVPWRRPPAADIVAPGLVAMVLVLSVAAWRLISVEDRRDGVNVPVTALSHVPPQLAARPVFNDYSFGGWLIFNGVRPFIDGRADMYGDAFVQTYLAAEAVRTPSDADQALRRYGVVWTILQPTSPLVAHLDHSPGWRRLYADKWAVVQVRDDAWPPPASATVVPQPVK